MPKWGLAMKEGSVTSWLKNEGDKINKGETFVEIETEKVVNEFESPEAVSYTHLTLPTKRIV